MTKYEREMATGRRCVMMVLLLGAYLMGVAHKEQDPGDKAAQMARLASLPGYTAN